MRKAIVSVSVGEESEELSQFSRPTFTAYAQAHGYTIFVLHEAYDRRPASWSKLPAMLELVGSWDTIVCIDIDAMICRWDEDYFQQVLDNTQGAVAFAVESDAQVPNCGLWIVRGKYQPSIDFLTAVNNMDGFYRDATVEQAAVHQLLGYSRHPGVPSIVHSRNTILLPPRYNDTCFVCDDPIVKHWAGHRHHVRVERMSAELGLLGLAPTPMKRIES